MLPFDIIWPIFIIFCRVINECICTLYSGETEDTFIADLAVGLATVIL